MRLWTWVVSTVLLGSAMPSMAGITVDLKEDTDFDQYSSFAWVESDESDDARLDSRYREADDLIRAAVNRELADLGLREVTEDPDLLIRTNFVVRGENRNDVDILEDDGRWGATGEEEEMSGQPGEYVRDIEMGTLTVDLLDGYSKLEVWRATATAVVRPRVNKRSEKRIYKVVGKMFESYPLEE